ncbi:hypothetical protein A0J61_02803 [Choanephora cucurbitarum]|uniref:Xylanolytic transcriptional activator regulatory domain-containing protein n=1 Tax=Choanephora cucurbitarum TaxID=101091 RepID=A0A1C7NK19_9FUNG|nr:hypothetical protein A0J61_02803 [Choanephora cucurbitarum]
MITQGQFSPLSFSKKDINSVSSSVLIEQFLKEAKQILRHAGDAFYDPAIHQSLDRYDASDAEPVTWQLNLTPTMMTLDTSILTVSGLERVLELIRINVKPLPPRFHKDRQLDYLTSDQHDIPLFRYLFEPVLQISRLAMIPRPEQLQHNFNQMQTIRHCIDSFIRCGLSFFVDIPSLLANTEMITSQPGAIKEHRVEALLIFSISALMARHSMRHHQPDKTAASTLQMHIFYSQARELLQDLFDVHHVAVVQSMFILSLYPQRHIHLFSPQRISSPLLTMAIRMALAMDLHKIDKEHGKDSDQKERLRRLAWMLLCVDYYTDWNMTGKTGLMDVDSWHVDFPQILPGETSPRQVEFFSHYCRVIMIRKMDLFRSGYKISIQSPKALESTLDEKLYQTFFNTPDTFQLDFDEPSPLWITCPNTESLLLHELYCHTQLTSQLPFLPKRYLRQFAIYEDDFRYQTLNGIHQGITRLNQSSQSPFSFRSNLTYALHHHQAQSDFSTETDKELEFYCIVNLLEAINKYTLLLEVLELHDPSGCHHSPVYGVNMIIHLLLIIQMSCLYPQVHAFCQTNLVRTQRILRGARNVYADPIILFLERTLSRHGVQENNESIATLRKMSFDLVQLLKAQSSYAHDYEEDDYEDERNAIVKRIKQE